MPAISVSLRFRRPLALAFCHVLGVAGVASAFSLRAEVQAPPKPTVPVKIDYNRDIQPILSKHCWPCHGADKAALEKTGGLRLDQREGATADRGGYAAIVPGKPEESMLWKRVNAPDNMRMPPATAPVPALSPEQKALIKRWIAEGAEYKGHWAFEAPRLTPAESDPSDTWSRNAIDRYIWAELKKAGLKPEKEADRATLLRRLSLTLTGLPPTPQEVNAFLADKSANAYEKQVDRLLASPRYGENQARYWLDAVRYADTHGLHIDNERAVYPYRDWVVRAYNEDLPFDKFTKWQLAGDLFPEPTLDQMIATGYVRMNPTTAEGGVIEAEFLAKNTFDRIDTTATIFMGMTVGCAKCHDHKYDPISTKEYYSLYAFFNSTQDPVLDGNLKLHQPVMKAPYPEQRKQLVVLEQELKKKESQVSLLEAKNWLEQNGVEAPVVGKWEISAGHEGKTFAEAFGKDYGPEPGGPEDEVKWTPIDLQENALRENIVGKEIGSAYLQATVTSKKGGSYALRLGSDDGIKVWLNGKLVHSKLVFRALAANQDSVQVTLEPGENKLLVKVVNGGGNDGIYVGLSDEKGRRLAKAAADLAKSDAKPEEVRDAIQTYLELGPESAVATEYRKVLADYRKLDAEIPFTYIAKEMPKPRETFVLKRGSYETPGEKVERGIPGVFGSWNPAWPRDRMGLADWLVDKRNPLTARVFVNRVWQQHFGTGIVKSAEDFGTRGEWPSHPELLDYLAVKFVEQGWSLKKLHRMILTSSAYRQASTASKEKWQKDPENRLISRGPRFRLDAEVVRDQGLYLSGLLVEHPGGRGDKPYQPAGLWEAIAYPISDTARYVQDSGEALYRRSLYLFWKRTSPPPTMLIFDAPMRESCVVRRSRTNTPTQALVTLNETGFFESARVMAERVIRSKPTDALRLDFAFRMATGRSPSAKESELLLKLLRDRLAFYGAHHSEAHRALEVGDSPPDRTIDAPEVAAWALVCNAILNLDEVLTLH